MAAKKNTFPSDDGLSFLYTFLDTSHMSKTSPINKGKNKSPILDKPLLRRGYEEEIYRLTAIFNEISLEVLPRILSDLKVNSPYLIKKIALLDAQTQPHFYFESSHRIIQAFCLDMEKALRGARSRNIGDLSAYAELSRNLERPGLHLSLDEDDDFDDDEDDEEESDIEAVRENSENTLLGFMEVEDLVRAYVEKCVLERGQANLKAFRADFYDDEIAAAYLTIIFGLIVAYLRVIESFKRSTLYLGSLELPAYDADLYMEAFQDEIGARALADEDLRRAAALLGALVVACADFSLCGMVVKLIGVRGSRNLVGFAEAAITHVVTELYESS